MTDSVALELLKASGDTEFRDGSAEPWVRDVLAALLVANASRNVVEIGGFRGATSARLLAAMQTLPWPKSLTVCEIDAARAADVRAALDANGICNYAKVVVADSLEWIPTLPNDSLDFVWLDGNHEQQHVYNEICMLYQKLAPGGLLCGHDVYGVCDLRVVFGLSGGYSLDFPRLGPAGGVGLLQRPR